MGAILQLQVYLFSETEPYADASGVPRTQKSPTLSKVFSIFYRFLLLFVNLNTSHMTS